MRISSPRIPALTGMRVDLALQWATKFLTPKFPEPDIEARALLAGFLDCSTSELFLKWDRVLDAKEFRRYRAFVVRRSGYEPVAYIIGRKNFLGRDFLVNEHVLVPRPETELLVEEAMNLRPKRVLEIGTGSGCIAISLALSFPEAEIVATDISAAALELAERNAALKSAGNVRFLRSDLYKALGPEFQGYFDMILCNPPYISTPEMGKLEPDLKFEPRLALEGGADGLAVIRPLVRESGFYLKRGGTLMLEMGYQQRAAVDKILAEAGFSGTSFARDYGGHDRIVKGTFIGPI